MQEITFKELVLIGGGHGHVHVLKMIGMKSIPGVRVTLISRDVDTPYSGMLPGYVAGQYTREQCHLDLRQICSFASIRFLQGEVCGLDTTRKLIYFKDSERPPLSYHVVSIDIGIVPKIDCVEWNRIATLNITPVKPIDRFSSRWTNIVQKISSTSSPSTLRVVIVGGGAGGCELALAIHSRLTKEFQSHGLPISSFRVILVHKGSEIMPIHNPGVRRIVSRLLIEKGIALHLNANVVNVTRAVDSTQLLCEDGQVIESDEVIWCTQAAPQEWLRQTSLDLTSDGFILVKQTLQSLNNPDVFACGDVCEILGHPRPKAGVFAVRAGPPLLNNLKKRILGEELLDDWTPQEQFLGIIGTGGSYAVASRGPLALEGEYLWTLKDHIDRTWMDGYRNLKKGMGGGGMGGMLSALTSEHQSLQSVAENIGADAINLLLHSKMRCGGCGSKVGSQILDRVLKKIKKFVNRRDDIVGGLGVSSGDDAALIRLPLSNPLCPLLSVHSIDYFRSFLSDPFVLGKIAAVHALSDLHAMGAQPVSALALCVLPYGPEKQVENDLTQLLAGVCSVLKAENCSLVGGHTSEGNDFAIGLSVNGYIEEGHQTAKGPPQDGDLLILTKPLGTGVILAADMRGEAKGEWVSGAIENMIFSNKLASNLLQSKEENFACSGCTDVTGFGLMGHLLEMMKYQPNSMLREEEEEEQGVEDGICTRPAGPANEGSVERLEVTIHLSEVPLLTGAVECVELGVLSSLHPQNLRCARAVVNSEDISPGNSRYPLLYDPQTSGGLLIVLPASQGQRAIERLHQIGYPHAAIIGSFRTVASSLTADPTIRIESTGQE